MRTLLWRATCLALAVVTVAVPGFVPARVDAGTTTLEATPSTKTVEETSGSATVEIDIVAKAVTNLSGWQFYIHNPSPAGGSLPRITSIAPGAQWNTANDNFGASEKTWGYIVVAYEFPVVVGKSGDSALAHVTISYGTAAPGTYTFTLDNTGLFDTVGGPIAHTVTSFTLVVEAKAPPQPDPPTLLVTGKTTTSVNLESSECTDRTPPVTYQFNNGAYPGATFRNWDQSRTATDSGLAANTQYTYRVRAKDSTADANTTGWSSDCVTYTLPVAPNVTSSGTVGSHYPLGTTFTFTNMAGWGPGNLDHYRYVWTTSPTHTFNGTEPDTWSAATLDLTANSDGQWYLHVRSENQTNDPNGTAMYGPYDVGRVPLAPTDFTHGPIATDSITWQWTDNATDEDEYIGYNQADAFMWTEGSGTGLMSHTEAGLGPNVSYTRYVKASNIYGQSSKSNNDTAYTAIETPTGIAFGTVGTTSIEARSIDTPSNLTSGLSGLNIYNATVPAESDWKQNNDYWMSSSLAANTPYTFYAKAKNGDGEETGASPSAVKWTLPVAPNVTCNETPGAGHYFPTGTVFTFTNAAGWGSGALNHYLYVWSNDASHDFVGSEDTWQQADGDTKPLTATHAGMWYLHVQSRNGQGASGGEAVYGPFDVGDLPADPTNFTHTAITTSSITWGWTDNAGDEESYIGYDGADAQMWTVGFDVSSYAEPGLSANTLYARYVKATNKYGQSAKSNDDDAYTAIETPSGIAFGIVGTTAIEAKSTDGLSNLIEGQSGVRVHNDTMGTDSDWQQTEDFWNSTGLVANKAYTFHADARNGDGIGTGPSPTATKWTLPVAPNVSCDKEPSGNYFPTGTTFTFTNDAGWGDGALDHYLYVWDTNSSHTFGGGEASWSQADGDTKPLAAGTKGMWYLHVMSVNGEGVSGEEATYGPFDVGDLPADPTNFAHSTITTSSITWGWTDNADDEEGYIGYDGTDAQKWAVGVDVSSYTEPGLSANTLYARYVKATNKYGLSAKSNDDDAYTAIETPTGLTFGTVTNQSVVLNATGALSNLAVAGSGVFFDETGGSNGGINVWVQVATDTATGLVPNTQYTFHVKAQNGDAVETAYSPAAQKYTLATPPGAEALSAITASDIQANWNAGTPANPAGTVYLVECYEGPNFAGTKKGDSGEITALSHVFSGLDPNKQYSFRVKAKNGEGIWTGLTVLGSAYTRPNSPGALTIDMQVMNGLVLKLTAPGCRSLSIVSIALNGNPAGTQIAIKVQSGGWLKFSGSDVLTNGVAEEWHTAAQWAGKRIRGLTPNTAYTFEAKARNDDAVPLESGLVNVGTYSTNEDGDANRNGTTSIQDLILVRTEVLKVGTVGTTASWAADINDDRMVSVSDMNAVRTVILNQE